MEAALKRARQQIAKNSSDTKSHLYFVHIFHVMESFLKKGEIKQFCDIGVPHGNTNFCIPALMMLIRNSGEMLFV